jgi:hypothetical protein
MPQTSRREENSMISDLARLGLRMVVSLALLSVGATSALCDVSIWNNDAGGKWSVGDNCAGLG